MEHPVTLIIPVAVRDVAAALIAGGHDALLVGGCVRDALLGRAQTGDWDLATDASPGRVRDLVGGLPAVRSLYPLGERFGTVGIALASGGRIEVTRYRDEAMAQPIRLDRVVSDLGHRDLTVNAMAFDLSDDSLIDPFGGGGDLGTRVLRAPGSPEDRFAEDPIRVVRVARFVSELDFFVDTTTADAMRGHAVRLSGVAVERLRVELTKLLMGVNPVGGLQALRDSGALAVVLPEVAALDGLEQPSFHDLDVLAHTAQAVGVVPADPVLRWATLLHDVGKAATRSVDPDGRIRFFGHAQEGARLAEAVCIRLRFPNSQRRAVVHLVAEHMRLGEVNTRNTKSVDRAVRKLDLWAGPNRIVGAEDALALTIADFSATAHRKEAPAVAARLETALRESRERGTRTRTKPPIGGRELMEELGLPEGPLVGTAQQAIVSAIGDGSIRPEDRAAALQVAREALDRLRMAE